MILQKYLFLSYYYLTIYFSIIFNLKTSTHYKKKIAYKIGKTITCSSPTTQLITRFSDPAHLENFLWRET